LQPVNLALISDKNYQITQDESDLNSEPLTAQTRTRFPAASCYPGTCMTMSIQDSCIYTTRSLEVAALPIALP
jgi:hypothetical protein